MTEVKRGNGSSSLPLKKPQSFNNTSSSYKHIYEDVFASPHHSRQQSSAFIDDDYAEMFGSSKSDNGTWSVSYSSIPVLDLPPPSEMRVRGMSGVTIIAGESRLGDVDYGGVFGGVGDVSFGLPDGEDLFDQFKKKAKTSSSYTMSTRSQGQTLEAMSSQIMGQSQIGLPPMNDSTPSFDSIKHHKQKNNQIASKRPAEVAEVAASARDCSEISYSINEAGPTQKAVVGNPPLTKDDIELGQIDNQPKKQEKHLRHTSLDLGVRTVERDISFVNGSGSVGLNSVNISHEIGQPGRASPNSQSLSSANRYESESKNASYARTNDAISVAEVHTVGICTDTDTLHNVDNPNHQNLSIEPPVLKDDTSAMEVDLAEKQGSYHKTSGIGLVASKQSGEHLTGFQNAAINGSSPEDVPQDTCQVGAVTGFQNAAINGSTSVDVPQDVSQVDAVAGSSKVVSDDVAAINVGIGRKKARHSRMTSLDLGDKKPPREGDGQHQRRARFGGSYSFDASHDPCAARVKVQPSMMAPSTSLPQFFPVESHYKISENSSYRRFDTNFHIANGGSPPSLDEQLDTNSAAAMSAAALQSAMEEAAMIIHLAKEYLKRESQGSSKFRFKDTLKVNEEKSKQHLDEMNLFCRTMLHKESPAAGSENKQCRVLEKSSVLEDGQPSPVYEDQEEFIKYEPVVKLRNVCGVQNEEYIGNRQPLSVPEDQKEIFKEEPGSEMFVRDEEYNGNSQPLLAPEDQKEIFKEEPASELAVLQGVDDIKNGGTSLFVEDRKIFVKDEPVFEHQEELIGDEECTEGKIGAVSKSIDDIDRREGGEWEAAKHLNQLFSGVKNKIASFMAWQTETEKKEEPKETEQNIEFQQQSEDSDLGMRKQFNIKRTEMDQDATAETVHVELEIGFVSDAVEPNDPESFSCKTMEQENAESRLDFNESASELASDNFAFLPFRNERVRSSSDVYEEEIDRYRGSKDVEMKSVREQLMDEMKYEELQGQCEKEIWERADDEAITVKSSIQDHVYSHRGPNIVEVNEILEESQSFLAGQSRMEPTFEEVHTRNLDECGVELGHSSRFHEIAAELSGPNVEHEEYEEIKDAEHCNTNVQIINETDLGEEMEKNPEATEILQESQENEIDQSQISDVEESTDYTNGWEESEANESLAMDQIMNTVEEVAGKVSCFDVAENVCEQNVSGCVEVTKEMPEEFSCVLVAEDEYLPAEDDTEHCQKISEQLDEQSTCFAAGADECEHTDDFILSKGDETLSNDGSSTMVEDDASLDQENDRMSEIPNSSSETKLENEDSSVAQDDGEFIGEETLLQSENHTDYVAMKEDLDVNESHQFENFVMPNSQSGVCSGKEESDNPPNISENEISPSHHSGETPSVRESHDTDQEVANSGIEAVPKRRRWFDSAMKIGPVEIPSILEGDKIELVTEQVALDDSELSGSVEIHAYKLDSFTNDVGDKDPDAALNLGTGTVDVEATPKRRRWFVKRGEEGLPEPPPLFQGINMSSEEPQKMVDEVLRPSVTGGSLDQLNAESAELPSVRDSNFAFNGEKDNKSVEAAPRRKRWFESGEFVGPASNLRPSEDIGEDLEMEQVSRVKGGLENHKLDNIPTELEKEDAPSELEPVNEHHRLLAEVNRREKEKEKEKIAVERVIREARERAFAEARERARRDAVEKPNVEARQRVGAGAQERPGKVSADVRSSSEKASMEAKLRAERAAVERATAEVRERALQKALSEKDLYRSREQGGRIPVEKKTSTVYNDPNSQCSSSSSRSDLTNKEDKNGVDSESAQRCKAQQERQSRTMERAAKALEEKNRRDLLAQKEQAAKNMLADSLDAEVKRWCAGKEGNLRMLLSTLQYILGPESGWQAISLTDLMAATAVRKAYKKATLCVHPDKLQQRGASIQQKYICEKVFDLLKDAWSKFSPSDR